MVDLMPALDRRDTNVVLEHHSSQAGLGCLIALAVFWNGITYTVGGAFFLAGKMVWIAWIILPVFMLIGLLLIVGVIVRIMVRSKMHPPVLTVSSHPLSLGEPFQVRFQQSFKSRAELNGVHLTLTCQETAQYTQGTTTHSVTHDVFTSREQLVEARSLQPLSDLDAKIELQIPADAMHTFRASDNQIEWILESHTDIAGWPDYKVKFAIDVAPRRHDPKGRL